MKKIIILMILVFSIVMISGCVENIDPHTREYAGQELHFRANLTEAENIPVYPDEDSIRSVLFNPNVYKIFIYYISNISENSFYLADSYEISYKLIIIYKYKYQGGKEVITYEDEFKDPCVLFTSTGRTICIASRDINSTDEVIPTDVEPAILLLGPSQTNKTGLTVEYNLITVEGESFEEINRTYTDLDLATDKLLLVLMEE